MRRPAAPIGTTPAGRPAARLAAALLLALCAAATAGAAPTVRPPTLTVARSGAGVRVELATGRAMSVRLQPGERLTAIAGAGERWAAAGVRSEGDGDRLSLLTAAHGTVRRLATPEGPAALLRADPTPLTDAAGDLVGLAWLEGDGPRALAVRFAARTGAGWGPVETVAPPGPGSQLALSAAVLEDGTRLLVWSAFDGEDDEIRWSASGIGGWSRPRRLAVDNAVPDITPALVAVPGGALAAWSRFDGTGYRLHGARFHDGAWSEPQPLAASGSLFPSFVAAGPRPQILYRTAAPSGWAVLELDVVGRPLRRAAAALAGSAAERPVVRDAADASPQLAWPGGGRRAVRLGWENLP